MNDPTPALQELPVADETSAVPPSGPGRGRSWKLAAVVLTVVVLVAAAVGVYVGNQRWGRRAMVETAVSGIEALVTGDGSRLSALSEGTARTDLTPEVVRNMEAMGLEADFSAPVWNGDNAIVSATTGKGKGVLIAGPPADGADVVVFRTMGALSATTGALSLARAWSGWVITGLTVGPSAPTTSSASPTAAPPASAPSTPTAP